MYSHCNSPTFINILSALDRCNEWGLYYTGLVTFPHVVLLNQLNWFSIIFCLQSPDSRLFPEWLRNTSSQNWISPRFSSWKYILEFIEIHSFSAGKINFSGKKPNKNIFLTQPSPWFDSVKSNNKWKTNSLTSSTSCKLPSKPLKSQGTTSHKIQSTQNSSELVKENLGV